MTNMVTITGYGESSIRTTMLTRKAVDIKRLNEKLWYQCEIGTLTTGTAFQWYPARRVITAATKVTRPALQKPAPCTALMIRPTVALMKVAL